MLPGPVGGRRLFGCNVSSPILLGLKDGMFREMKASVSAPEDEVMKWQAHRQ
jgi:hypothetical protein